MAIYKILEVANTHGGDKKYVISLIEEFRSFTDCAMKFQPFKYDKIATPDFEWYPVYQQLFFNESEWKEIIDLAATTKDIWLDLFDEYGITILKENLKKIYGLKLQASVIDNLNILRQLSQLDLSKVHLILNISGFDIFTIKTKLESIQKILNPKEILIEVGFQAYPTSVPDSGLSKIKVLKENFANRIVFADHVDATSDDAIWLPVLAAFQGVNIIEKHIKHSILETKYDHYSSINVTTYEKLSDKLDLYAGILKEPFINNREREYLKKTLQIPIVNRNLRAGEIISMLSDIDFKRSGLSGLNVTDLRKYLDSYYITADEIKKGHAISKLGLKKATIATIIACRLKSSRLPKKAILKIGKLSSVELCVKNSLRFKNINHTILATSDLEEDKPLENYTYRNDVIFQKGDAEDVIKRYLSICDQLKIDIVIRITADMPYVAEEIFDLLLASHFSNGADFTYATNAAVGTSIEVISTSALRKIKEYFPSADYSEYMSWYFKNNPDHFKLNQIELPAELSRNYRLTLDYQEDLILFNKIEENFGDQEFGLKDIFDYLDKNPAIAAINSNLSLKYLTDQNLIAKLNKATKIQQ
jgi:spore coat polysaccharide biosynthesis protein SpsF (cytidylyltransferase family)/sialic acid synthase SpsE